MNKRGFLTLQNTFIFIILNVVFFAILFIAVAIAGTGVKIKEQAYAKQISLTIDQAKKGTNFTIDISELYETAKKNKYEGIPVSFNYNENKVIVKLGKGEGYSHVSFTKLKSGSIVLDETNKQLTISV